MDAMLLHFEDDASEAASLAQAAGLARAQVSRCTSTRNELGLQLPPSLPPQVALFRNFAGRSCGAQTAYSQHLLELLLFERMASRQGVCHLTLVAPDLGRDLSQNRHSSRVQVLEDFLGGLFDAVLTIDPGPATAPLGGVRLPLHHALLPAGLGGVGKSCAEEGLAAGGKTDRSPQPFLRTLDSALRALYRH